MHEELRFFTQHPLIDPSVIEKAYSYLAACALNSGDRVKITSGEQAGMVGTIATVVDDVAEVLVDKLSLSIPTSMLRKDFRIGDEVVIKDGAHDSFTGWVVSLGEDMLSVHSHQSHIEVFELHYYYPTLLTPIPGPSPGERNRFPQSRFHFFISMPKHRKPSST
jgi:ribosomal protein L24